MQTIAGTGQAVLGGEVWLVVDGRITGLIPAAIDDEPAGVWHWDTEPKGESESWPEYCARTAAESKSVIRDMKVEDESKPEVGDSLFFNITYVDETDV